jgi:hypothetical protein
VRSLVHLRYLLALILFLGNLNQQNTQLCSRTVEKSSFLWSKILPSSNFFRRLYTLYRTVYQACTVTLPRVSRHFRKKSATLLDPCRNLKGEIFMLILRYRMRELSAPLRRITRYGGLSFQYTRLSNEPFIW